MELSVHAAAKAEALPLAMVVQSLNVLAMDACYGIHVYGMINDTYCK